MAGKRRVLIVGAGEVGHQLARTLQDAGYDVVGFVDDEVESVLGGLRVLGCRTDIERLVKEHDIDEVLIAYAPTWQQRLAEMLVSNGHRRVQIKVVPNIVDIVLSGPVADRVGDIPVVDITPRLPLAVTLHTDRFDDSDARARIAAYDRRRTAIHPYRFQRAVDRFGRASSYGWSEDKARQYASPERTDFGAFVRSRGFCLD